MEIEFIEYNEFSKLFYDIPQNSIKSVPKWYKDIPSVIGNEKKRGLSKTNNEATNTTIKSCMPFLDAMSLGYIWSLPADLEISNDGENLNFKWRTEDTLVTFHDPEQHPGLPNAYNGYDIVGKWNFDYVIKTPKGYGTFFTHPVNRHDLPFRTFSGFVDTDKYSVPVQFPFQWLDKNSEKIILEKGTPLCQFFPVKRDSWHSKKIDYDLDRSRRNMYNLKSKIVNSYKNQFRSKK